MMSLATSRRVRFVGRHEDPHRRSPGSPCSSISSSTSPATCWCSSAPTSSTSTRTRSMSNPLLPIIEIGAAAGLPVHIYKTVTMFLGNQQRAAGRLRAEEARRPPSRKTLRLVDDDRLRALAAGVPRHSRQGVQGTAPSTSRPAADATSIALEMENFAIPLMVAFYVLSMLVVGSHLWHGVSSAFQSLGVDQPALDAVHPAGRQGARRAASPAASSSSRSGRTSREARS